MDYAAPLRGRGKYDDTLDGLLGDNALHKHIRSSKKIDTAPSQNPTKTTESGIEDNKNTDIDSQKYYCHHVNSWELGLFGVHQV